MFRNLRQLELALVVMAGLFCIDSWADPPGRVGRLSAIDGTVSLYDDDSGNWRPVPVNWPVTGGDTLWSGPGDRANIRIGSTVLRLDGSTELQILRLDDAAIDVRLLNGSIAVRLDDTLTAQQFHLESEHGRTTLIEPGRYRFDFGDFTTTATVYRGQLAFEGNGQGYVVAAGQRGEFWYTGSLEMRLSDIRRDDFHDWIVACDRREDRWRAPRYVSTGMTGYEDLDRYGDWEDSDEFGVVWTPRHIPAGWSPYRYGHWALIAPWGWTWIDDSPWGFAPFHYGRWVFWRGAWSWVPGSYDPAPTYAPALVAWVGQPGGAPLRLDGTPAVGWFPLGPREAYVPPYRAGERTLRSLNRDEDEDARVRPHYRYRQMPQAVTVVPLKVLTEGHAVNKSYNNRTDLRALANAPVSHDAPAHWQTPPRSQPHDSGTIDIGGKRTRPAMPPPFSQSQIAPNRPVELTAPTQAAKPTPRPPQEPLEHPPAHQPAYPPVHPPAHPNAHPETTPIAPATPVTPAPHAFPPHRPADERAHSPNDHPKEAAPQVRATAHHDPQRRPSEDAPQGKAKE
jgi:hypothetical protein